MQIEIFTEDSETRADRGNVERVDKFFKGRFRNIKNFSSELDEYGDVTIHILSDEFGYVRGSDLISDLTPNEGKNARRDFSESILEVSKSADVVLLLLTRTVFEEVVASQWDELVSNANNNSVWCIGVSKSAISSVNLDELRAAVKSVIFYERVGVARISSEYKTKLLAEIGDEFIE